MSAPETQLAKRDLNVNSDKPVIFKPFGAADEIRLSIEIIQNMVAVPTKSGRTCSKRDALRFMMLCQAQRLNPFAGDAYLVGYDSRDPSGNILPSFSLITAHQALLKRAEASNDFEGMESGIILIDEAGKVSEREGDFHTPDEKVIGGWAKVYRKGRRPTYKRIAIEQRKPKYDSGFWAGNKASEQIVKCAEGDALRSTFPTLLGGLYIAGETDERADKFVAEVSADRVSGGFNASGLVENSAPAKPAKEIVEKLQEQGFSDTEGEGTDLGPQKQKPTGESPPTGTNSRAELEQFLVAEGFTFDHLQKFGVQSGAIDGADAMSSWEDIPEATCKRLIRAKVGLKQALIKIKEEAR